MEKTVIVSKRFRKNILSIHQYLLKEFSPIIANEFPERLEKRVDFIIQNPTAGKPSQRRKNVRSLLFTPHNQIFYRFQKNKIELLCIADMRKTLPNVPIKVSYPAFSCHFFFFALYGIFLDFCTLKEIITSGDRLNCNVAMKTERTSDPIAISGDTTGDTMKNHCW